MSKELQIIEKEISPIAVQAISLEIMDDTTLKTGVELLSKLNQYNDRITEEKEKVTKPLNEALKAERGRWKPLETVYNDAIASIRAKMTSYQTNLVKQQNLAKEKVVAKVQTGYIKPETAVGKLEAIGTVEKEHATEVGLVQFRETPTLKITNITAVQQFMEYWDLNETKLLKDLKAGKIVEGAEIEIIQTPVNYR